MSDSDAPFGDKKRDMIILKRVLKAVFALTATALFALIAYAGRTYVKDVASQQVSDATTALALLPAKVQSLEEFRTREETQSANMQGQVNQIFLKLTALETMQEANNKNTERILRKLDSSSSR